jgi:hypothetical protein
MFSATLFFDDGRRFAKPRTSKDPGELVINLDKMWLSAPAKDCRVFDGGFEDAEDDLLADDRTVAVRTCERPPLRGLNLAVSIASQSAVGIFGRRKGGN